MDLPVTSDRLRSDLALLLLTAMTFLVTGRIASYLDSYVTTLALVISVGLLSGIKLAPRFQIATLKRLGLPVALASGYLTGSMAGDYASPVFYLLVAGLGALALLDARAARRA